MNIASPKAFAIMFSELLRWDAKFFSSRLKGRFPFTRLGPFVRERSERHNLFEFPEKIFRILGVNNTGGVFHAYDTPGSRINQPYKHVEAGDFFYNPYRVNVGSIGLVPPELGGNFVSPAYVVFSVDHKVIAPDILGLILKSRWYNNTLRSATAGSVRQNLTFDLLQMLEVPLPPIETQQLILAQWRKAHDEITAAEMRAKQYEQESITQILHATGITLASPTKKTKCYVMRLLELDRWGVEFNRWNWALVPYPSGTVM